MTGATPQPVEIVGGGLAGLSLGLALRRAGVPVTVWEAHDYPRHRVCGEFIAGLDEFTVTRLGLASVLADALRHRTVVWHRGNATISVQTLPAPALGLSRHAFDARLAEAFVAAGGDLRVRRRLDCAEIPAGRIFAYGRRRRRSPWLGLKLHARALQLAGDLEVHLGNHAYIGLSRVENGRINVCGLFRRLPLGPDTPSAAGAETFLRYTEESGLAEFADRLRLAEIDEDSFCAVSALSFRPEPLSPDRICLGDSFAMPPPFTGNGMTMALQSAALALDPLLAWSRGDLPWTNVVMLVNRRLRRRFRSRLASANLLHPFLLRPARQRWLAAAGRAHLLPLRPLYFLTH